jgi:hypothetical protein
MHGLRAYWSKQLAMAVNSEKLETDSKTNLFCMNHPSFSMK